MSIVALKRRAESTIGVSSSGGFSLQGNHRNPASVVGGGGFSFGSSHQCTPEDSTVHKSAVMTNSGMLATRFPKRGYPYTVAAKSMTDYSHGEYLAHIKYARIAPCPDPAVKQLRPRCVPDATAVPGACTRISNSRMDRAWATAAGVPNMPGKVGAQDYSAWLVHRAACAAFASDPFTLAGKTALIETVAAQSAVLEAVQEQVDAFQAQVAANASENAATASEGQAALNEAIQLIEDAFAASQNALYAALAATTWADAQLAADAAAKAADDAAAAVEDANSTLISAQNFASTTELAKYTALNAYIAAQEAVASAQAIADALFAYANSI